MYPLNIRASHLPQTGIKASDVAGPGNLQFNFRYLGKSHAVFGIGNCDKKYFRKLLVRLKDLCCKSTQEVQSDRGSALRSNPITWADTSQAGGFGLHEQLGDAEAYELCVSANKGRFHGFFIDDYFFVVWLDPDHKLCPRR